MVCTLSLLAHPRQALETTQIQQEFEYEARRLGRQGSWPGPTLLSHMFRIRILVESVLSPSLTTSGTAGAMHTLLILLLRLQLLPLLLLLLPMILLLLLLALPLPLLLLYYYDYDYDYYCYCS